MAVQVADDSGVLNVEFQNDVVSKLLDGLKADDILSTFDVSIKDVVRKVLFTYNPIINYHVILKLYIFYVK